MHTTPLNRRQWLKRSSLGLTALGTAGLGALLAGPRHAVASDYKALVCVFLYGGSDGNNVFVPMDATRYGQYNAVRGPQGLALPLQSLLPMGNSGFGLHPAMAALQTAWSAGHLAPVFNVGPLAAPLTKAQYRAAAADSPLIPESLFSHSDQQTLWETGTTTSLTRTGWGGRAAEAMATVNPVISLGGNGRYGVASLNGPLVLPGPGANFGAYELGPEEWRQTWAPAKARADALRALYNEPQANVLTEALSRQQREAFATSERLAGLVAAMPGSASTAAIDAAFAPLILDGKVQTGLGKQLYQVAKLIAGNATVQGTRQIFFAQQGGYDTHGAQVVSGDATQGAHARLLKELADALACFHNAMLNLNMAQQVTSFTQSDFGRTFRPNDSLGSDHAWGNHHLVLGAAVRGLATYGRYPELVLGGVDDVGVDSWELHGRWLPSTSVDQYAATLLRWFGATQAQLGAALPNLGNFSVSNLGFMA